MNSVLKIHLHSSVLQVHFVCMHLHMHRIIFECYKCHDVLLKSNLREEKEVLWLKDMEVGNFQFLSKSASILMVGSQNVPLNIKIFSVFLVSIHGGHLVFIVGLCMHIDVFLLSVFLFHFD